MMFIASVWIVSGLQTMILMFFMLDINFNSVSGGFIIFTSILIIIKTSWFDILFVPTKIFVKDDRITIYRIFKKISFSKNDIVSIKPDIKKSHSFLNGELYFVKIKIKTKEKTFVLQSSALKNFDEFIQNLI